MKVRTDRTAREVAGKKKVSFAFLFGAGEIGCFGAEIATSKAKGTFTRSKAAESRKGKT